MPLSQLRGELQVTRSGRIRALVKGDIDSSRPARGTYYLVRLGPPRLVSWRCGDSSAARWSGSSAADVVDRDVPEAERGEHAIEHRGGVALRIGLQRAGPRRLLNP